MNKIIDRIRMFSVLKLRQTLNSIKDTLPLSMWRLLMITIVVVVFSCLSSQTRNSEKILFLAYELTKDSVENWVHVKVTQQILTEGTFFYEKGPSTAQQNEVMVVFLDNKRKQVHLEILPDPFIVEKEAVGDDGRLMRVRQEQKRAELLLRVPYRGDMKKVSILISGVGAHSPLFEHEITPNHQLQ